MFCVNFTFTFHILVEWRGNLLAVTSYFDTLIAVKAHLMLSIQFYLFDGSVWLGCILWKNENLTGLLILTGRPVDQPAGRPAFLSILAGQNWPKLKMFGK